MSGLNQRTFSAAIASGFYDLACGETISTLDSNLPDNELDAMAAEATDLPALFFRNIPDWQNTKRATLFPQNGSNYPFNLFGRIFLPTSNRWTPNIQRFLEHSKSVVRQAAKEVSLPRDIDSLLKWSPNRVGLNLMQAIPGQNAEVPMHTDPPEETGLVIALELIGSSAGKMSMIFSADVCSMLGLEQPEHEVVASTDRISLTLAELHKERPARL